MRVFFALRRSKLSLPLPMRPSFVQALFVTLACGAVAACETEANDRGVGGAALGSGGHEAVITAGVGGAAGEGGDAGGMPGACAPIGAACDQGDPPCLDTSETCHERLLCAQSYEEERYGKWVWQAHPPEVGTACSTVGELCSFVNAAMDSETVFAHALCTTGGWLTKSSSCSDGRCGSCPMDLPEPGGDEQNEAAMRGARRMITAQSW
jgi:hypothetical protein